MDLFKKCYDFTQVKEAVEAGIYPYFHALQSGQDTVVSMEGRRTIMIGSNNYLGLTSDPRVKEAAIKAVEKYGSGCSGSRFLNGTLDLHLELENALAEFLNKEACITFSTGFQSNLGIISAIAGRNDVILCDKENHASIYDACRLSYATMIRYKHSDMEDLEKALKEIPESKGILIVTDGVFSMGGEICKLPEIVELAKKYGARVMVDDAHGLGVLGEHGRGTAEHFGLEDEVDILMGTFSKSLASLGGYMAASAEVISYVKHTSRPFIFSASIPPANVASAICALDILKNEPQRVQKLKDIADYMRGLLRERNIPMNETETPIIPIMTYDDTRTFILCRELLNEGVYVNPVISPAVPQGFSMIRTSYTATHTRELMEEAADIFAKVFSKF
ncbi:MAG: aminotransferase class I/II-fold pyridoxal phosphate-dependent enzyme [Clostridiaceae bacterium]|jgi:8-amino-7-oxononanoate synthase|nr:aminotransferase class I/II-fold pyridoxal phosphate-dependent enzyme [Clostridiaceae bacterium]